jgi:hypothetical protein
VREHSACPVRQVLFSERVALPDRRGGSVEATCLIAREIGAPPGAKHIEWGLLSSRTVASLKDAVELIE